MFVGVSVDRIHENREPVGYHKFHEEAIDDEAQALVEITEPERNGPTLRSCSKKGLERDQRRK